MGFYIIKNSFAPKLHQRDKLGEVRNSHAILVNYCNFNCDFCAVDYAGKGLYKDYTKYEFEREVLRLIKYGKSFKFSGGEPTLCNDLEDYLEIVNEICFKEVTK